jgi:hypothetical protein
LPSRFREFVALRKELLDEFSEYPVPLPQLPPKTLLASTDPELLQQRRSMYAARAIVRRLVLPSYSAGWTASWMRSAAAAVC